MLGQQPACQEVSAHSGMSSPSFFNLYPALQPFLLGALESAAKDLHDATLLLHPSLYPVLTLLAKLQPGAEEQTRYDGHCHANNTYTQIHDYIILYYIIIYIRFYCPKVWMFKSGKCLIPWVTIHIHFFFYISTFGFLSLCFPQGSVRIPASAIPPSCQPSLWRTSDVIKSPGCYGTTKWISGNCPAVGGKAARITRRCVLSQQTAWPTPTDRSHTGQGTENEHVRVKKYLMNEMPS